MAWRLPDHHEMRDRWVVGAAALFAVVAGCNSEVVVGAAGSGSGSGAGPALPEVERLPAGT
jgi:hypothetical protein